MWGSGIKNKCNITTALVEICFKISSILIIENRLACLLAVEIPLGKNNSAVYDIYPYLDLCMNVV